MFKLVRRAKLSSDAAGGPDKAHAPPQGLLHGAVSDLSHLPTARYNNGEIPPAVAFAGGNPYLDRPLPTLPPRKPSMEERPSTSGGPGSRSKANTSFDDFGAHNKRVSRDDFYLTMSSGRPGPGWKHRPQHTAAAPRSQPLTPEGSPRSKAPPRPRIPVVRVPTPESMDGTVNGPIGMALGSPSHPPDAWPGPAWNPGQPQIQQQQHLPEQLDRPPRSNPVSPLSSTGSVDSYDMPKEKKQTGKWRLFGRFGRRHTERSLPVVRISDPNDLSTAQRPEQSTPRSQPESQGVPSRSNTTNTRRAPKHTPIVLRSQSIPSEPLLDPRRGTATSQDTFASGFGSIPIALDQGLLPGSPNTSLLNVDIPHTTMERYSVMFSGVLGKPASNSSSSLLARRQATVRELRKISNAVIQEEVCGSWFLQCLLSY